MNLKTIFSRMKRLMLISCMILMCDVGAFAQSIQNVKGTVLDASTQEPMIGVTVREKGTTNGAVTDINGNFTLNNVKKGADIVFSYVGYNTRSVAASRASGTILMDEEKNALNEVVVVGYGTQKKANLSGAVSAVDGEKLAAKPSSDVLAAMQGEMPGVTVLRSSGEPGSETSGLRIRGFSSANSTSTLVLIDGVEGDLSLLNADDIESISVLKDAAASAIYGARAAAGVVLVTTKSGKEGKVNVAYNVFYSWKKMAKKMLNIPF